jgi:uncharacterized membrane protein
VTRVPGDDARPRGLLAETTRVEAFSDGVLAIAITLLVLDLHASEQRGDFLRGLLEQAPVYVAYLASFAYIGVIWVNHHQLFTRVDAVDSGLLWRNLVLLLTTSVLPFPTSVLGNAFQHGDRHDQQVGLVFYALVASSMCLSWLAVYRHLSAHERLLAEGTPASFFVRERRRSWVGLAANLVSALVALWQPVAGLFVAALLPVFYGLTNAGLGASPRRPRSSGP